MYRNTASQKIALFVFDTSTGLAKTGDGANLTFYVNKDWAGSNPLGDTSATEIDNTKAPGWYLFDLTQAETDADALLFTGKSTTSLITVVGQLVFTAGNIVQINSDPTAASNMAKATRAICRGTVGSSASTTSIPTSAFTPAGASLDQFKGRVVTFDADTTTTALRGQATTITGSTNASTPTLTVIALSTSPVSGDTFSVT
jgi:hypothetical protein